MVGDASHTTTTTTTTTTTISGLSAHSRPPAPPGQPPPTSSYPERTLMDLVWKSDAQEQDLRKEHRKRLQEQADLNGIPDPYNKYGTHGPPDPPEDPDDFI